MQAEEIIIPSHVKMLLPMKEETKEFLSLCRENIKKILYRRDDRLLVIIGPCSIHHFSSAILFAKELKQLQQLYPSFYFVMRTHVEKPRSGLGWRGFLYDPDLDGTCDINKGISLSRTLMQHILAIEIPISGELLDPFTYPYFSDLYSMATIGARTILSPAHRDLAAKAPFPVGLKNSLDGDPLLLAHSLDVISSPNVFLSLNDKGIIQKERTSGNKDTFIILRGSHEGPNFSKKHLSDYQGAMKHLPPRMMIDCGHGNSQKALHMQKTNFYKVMEMIANGEDIMGVMLEVFFEEGKQLYSVNNPYQSITDPCLSLDDLKQMLSHVHETLLTKP
ncbi:MAG: 3-deoxy-7-phosphoheptulonate synthase [Chlamydiales bacterium]|nr:3-deoxy-7-phosphoheptulonate synthase [Chlamydiales bacterium]